MWVDFTDKDLIRLAYDYCLDHILQVEGSRLLNRADVERVLTRYEMDMAFA